MSQTVDFNKRSLFNGTKSEIINIFLSNINIGSNKEEYPEKKQEDVVKFINDLTHSPNPASMLYLYPDYSKYVSFFIESIKSQTKSILLVNFFFFI